MNIVIGNYKIRLEIVVLIVLLFWIMMGHVLCSCCKFNLVEGLEVAKEVSTEVSNTINKKLDEKDSKNNETILENNENDNNKPKPNKEGFKVNNSGSNALYEAQFANSKTPGYIMLPRSWSAQTLTYSPGKTPDTGVKTIWDRQKQAIPLPEGKLDFLSSTPFKPECCPNFYSNSSGCACITVDQYNYIQQRGGNNVPYSEY